MSNAVAQEAVKVVTHLDVFAISGFLLLSLIASLRLIINIKLKLIDDKIISNQNDIASHRKEREEYVEKFTEKMLELESNINMNVLRVNNRLDNQERDFSKLENYVLKLVQTVETNHENVSKQLSGIEKAVAVLISKNDN